MQIGEVKKTGGKREGGGKGRKREGGSLLVL